MNKDVQKDLYEWMKLLKNIFGQLDLSFNMNDDKNMKQ